jgi:hypothetical protein
MMQISLIPFPSHSPSSILSSSLSCVCVNLIFALNYGDIKILVVCKFFRGFWEIFIVWWKCPKTHVSTVKQFHSRTVCLECGRWVEWGVGGQSWKEWVGVGHLPANVSSGCIVLANGLGQKALVRSMLWCGVGSRRDVWGCGRLGSRNWVWSEVQRQGKCGLRCETENWAMQAQRQSGL